MSRTGRIIAALAIVGSLLGALPGTAPGTPAGAQRLKQPYHERHAMLKATNSSREHHRVQMVRMNRIMSRIARHHSLQMANRDELFHTTNPSSSYLRGVQWHYWGENVGYTTETVPSLEQAFMGSAPHRHNILNGTFQHVAIGAVRVDGVLWVTVFFYG